ncbi:Hsp20/alpha crystallin family protein [Sediminibacillus albus]|uniref:HSP20 family protein n=1 Tax=Sediminibacillus albus TaxID=407036 RepID=A0A1G9A5M4_9BACI|nr:Hsp20/alpha crystallin family protein [Sediminibacillus albus]SDK22682.1 HSP20 family protein [Sediminibacillus albus]
MEDDKTQNHGKIRQSRKTNPMEQMEDFFKNAPYNGLLSSIDTLFQQPLFHKTHIAVDLYETATEWVIEADIPGVRKENIRIEPMGDKIKIAVIDDQQTEESNEVNNYYRRERRIQGVERIVQLPYNVRKQKTKAKYNNGILEIRGPKDVKSSNNIDID